MSSSSSSSSSSCCSSFTDKIKKASLKQWLVVFAFIINAVIVNVANVALPLSNGEVSDLYTTIVNPASWIFGVIWPIIYITEAVFVIWQFFSEPEWANNSNTNFYGFVVWNISQAAWAILFPYEQLAACLVFIFFGDWLGLLVIELRGMRKVRALYANREAIARQEQQEQEASSSSSCIIDLVHIMPRWLRYYLIAVFPQALHLGWITAATGLNFVILIASENDTFGPQLGGAILVCCLIALVGFNRAVVAGDVAVAASLICALVAIRFRDTDRKLRLADDPSGFTTPDFLSEGFTLVAQILASLIGGCTIVGFAWRPFYDRFVFEKLNDDEEEIHDNHAAAPTKISSSSSSAASSNKNTDDSSTPDDEKSGDAGEVRHTIPVDSNGNSMAAS